MVHNHPSGDQQPTKEDHYITEAMIEAGRLMQIPLKDHVIIGKGGFRFLRERLMGKLEFWMIFRILLNGILTLKSVAATASGFSDAVAELEALPEFGARNLLLQSAAFFVS